MAALPVDPRFPLRFADEAGFALLRSTLRQLEFSDHSLCRRLQMDDMSDLGSVKWDLYLAQLPGRLRVAVELFVRGRLVHEDTVREALGEPVMAVLRQTGLIADSAVHVGSIFCPVWLYPSDGFLLASDRRDNPEGTHVETQDDVVFPGIYGGTIRFLKLLPDARQREALDLCGGSGIGAFHLARTASHAVTSDLTPRAAQFAEFNSRLNGLTVESVCGDLYQPVTGRQFDLITAHPPFVPSTGRTLVYRDAGETGEDVTRGIVQGLSGCLRDGGCCMITCIACDTHAAPLEVRVKEWLGEARDEFDVVFALEKIMKVEEVVDSIRRRGQNIGEDEVRALQSRLLAAGTRQFVYGTIWIERLKPLTPLTPLRVRMSPEAGAADFDGLRAFRRLRAAAGFFERLAGARPSFRQDIELNVRHVPRDRQLVPVEFVFLREGPLTAAFRPDGWVVPLLARLDGKSTVHEVFQKAADGDELPAGFPERVFLELVANLIEQGLMEIAD